jgi:hypothetical protein
MPIRDFDFCRKNPVDLICFSSDAGRAEASAEAFGYFAKSAGVTMFTRASVDCADRIVATSSSNALR